MLASILVEQVIYQRLTSSAIITDTVGESAHGLTFVPQDEPLPALLFHYQSTGYPTGSVNTNAADEINIEELEYVVKFQCEGTSTTPIEAAALEQLRLLAGLLADVEYDGRSYQISFSAIGEAPLPTLQENQNVYRQLGTVYSVEVVRG